MRIKLLFVHFYKQSGEGSLLYSSVVADRCMYLYCPPVLGGRGVTYNTGGGWIVGTGSACPCIYEQSAHKYKNEHAGFSTPVIDTLKNRVARLKKPRHSVCKMFITATSCPSYHGDRLRAVRRLLMCQLLHCCSISMMLQACLLLQHLPLLQEVIHIPFSYSLLFFLLHFLSAPV